MRLEALEGRYRETRSQGQASLPNSPRTRAAPAEAARVPRVPPQAAAQQAATQQAATQPAEALTTTRTNLNGVHQGLGLTPPAGLTVEPIRLAPAQCLPSVPLSTTPEPPWQGALPSTMAHLAPWLDARPSGAQEADMFKQVNGPEVPAHPQSLQPQQQAQSQTVAHPPRQSLSPESPALPWSPITGSLAPPQRGRGRGQSPPNSPGPNLGRNSPPLEPPMSHPSYPQPFLATRLPAPPGGGMMRECFA